MRICLAKHRILALAFLCCLCAASTALAAKEYPVNVSEAYVVREILPETSHVQKPAGMLRREHDILVTDSGANKIIILSLEGEYLGDAGTLGVSVE